MQDEVRDKSVALVINVGKRGGRMTADLLKWAIRRYLEKARNPQAHHGKQSVKQLVRQGAGVKNIEITDKNIRSFERIARKYGVDFAMKKDLSEGKYYVFFKARDEDVLNAAFTEYAAKSIHRKNDRPSLREQLAHFREVVKNRDKDAEKHREKGGLER